MWGLFMASDPAHNAHGLGVKLGGFERVVDGVPLSVHDGMHVDQCGTASVQAQKSSANSACNSSAMSYIQNEAGRFECHLFPALERTSEFLRLTVTPLRNGLIPQGQSYLFSFSNRTIRTTRTPATTATRMSARYRAIGTTSFLYSLEVRPAPFLPHSILPHKPILAYREAA